MCVFVHRGLFRFTCDRLSQARNEYSGSSRRVCIGEEAPALPLKRKVKASRSIHREKIGAYACFPNRDTGSYER